MQKFSLCAVLKQRLQNLKPVFLTVSENKRQKGLNSLFFHFSILTWCLSPMLQNEIQTEKQHQPQLMKNTRFTVYYYKYLSVSRCFLPYKSLTLRAEVLQ